MSIYLSVIILGLVQGLAEFLPISSSGHLVIFQSFLPGLDQISKDMTLDVLLHLGTINRCICGIPQNYMEYDN